MLYKKTLASFGVCLLLATIVFFSIKMVKSAFLDNFNFDSIRGNKNLEWNGPKEGEKIDLGNLKTRQGERFPQLPKQNLILLSIVDPKCEMCKTSQDLITQVQLGAKSNQIYFAMVSFASQENNEEYFNYAETLSKSNDVYLWQNETENPSLALQKMVVPSHLLLNEQGVVLSRFPGSSTDKTTREQMSDQIITEMLSEKAKHQ